MVPRRVLENVARGTKMKCSLFRLVFFLFFSAVTMAQEGNQLFGDADRSDDDGIAFNEARTRAFAVLGSVTRADVKRIAHEPKLQEVQFFDLRTDDSALAAFSNAKGLRRLELQECTGPTGACFAKLTHLPELSELYLNGCATLSMPDAAAIGRLKKLTLLCVNRTGIDDSFSKELRSIEHLEVLTAHGAAIGDHFLDDTPTADLRWLGLDTTKITDEGLGRLLARAEKLQRLDIGRTAIDGTALARLRAPGECISLHAEGVSFSKEGWAAVGRLGSLTYLFAESSNLDDEALVAIGRLDKLEELRLAETSVTDHGISSLLKLSRLQALDIRDTQTTSKCLEALVGLTNLRELWLPPGVSYEHEAVRALREKIPDLEVY